MYELINEKFIEIKEYKGQRVVTFKDIDTLHQRPVGTASRNFKANRQHFIEGVDFFIVKPADIQKDEFRPFEIDVPNRGIILLTESGYLMVVKSFTDDLAWKVQRQLINTYFRSKQIQQQNNYSDIDQTAIVMAIKELYEKNYELKEQIEKLNREQNKNNREFTAIIKILCEKMCGLYEKKKSRKSKSKKIY